MSEPKARYEDWWHDRTEGIGLATALDARSIYCTGTPHRQIEVLAHEGLGWCLAIDGVLQGVQQNSGYREMRIHVPLLGRARRECRVLLLGGGDGALLHELLQHRFVTSVVLCEPDVALIKVGTDYLGFGKDLCDPCVEVRDLAPQAALEFSHDHDDPFDVIVPAGQGLQIPSDALANCLAEDGVCVDSDWVVLGRDQRRWYRDAPTAGQSLLSAIQANRSFAPVEHYYAVSQLSPGGFIGYFLYTRDGYSYAEPRHDFKGLFYNPLVHRAAFALPSFWADLTSPPLQEAT